MDLLKNILFVLVLFSISYPSFIHGNIYSSDMNKLDNVFIKIEGSFSYYKVAESSNYSLFLPEGEYLISASSFDESGNLMYYFENNIIVNEEDQKIDLVLEPVSNSYLFYIIAILLIIVITLSFKFFKKEEKKQEVSIPVTNVLDENSKKVLQTIESFEGRCTQKELKQSLNFSDAKLSLILTELESLSKIKKFKRGRGNIIKKL
ncbi:MAG: hypothetical protein WC501_04625 [Candidatus Micrarchaeia archaeon]